LEADENAMLHAKKPVSVGHIPLEVSNLTAAKQFYGPLLDELGFKVILEDEKALGLGNENFKIFLGKPNRQRVSKKKT
jgi:catechol-2,3-dioxygenase